MNITPFNRALAAVLNDLANEVKGRIAEGIVAERLAAPTKRADCVGPTSLPKYR